MKRYWKYLLSLILAGTVIVVFAQVPASFIRSGMLLSASATVSGSGAIINNTAETIPYNSETAGTFPTVVKDTGGFTAGDANSLTIPAGGAGWYTVFTGGAWGGGNSGSSYMLFEINGTRFMTLLGICGQTSPSYGLVMTCAVPMYLEVGDVITVKIYQAFEEGVDQNWNKGYLGIKQ